MPSPSQPPPPVRLVGTGPGPVSMVTIQAREAIADAEVVRWMDGLGRGVLSLTAPGADTGPFRSEEDIVKAAHAGRAVSVLYPGDPYVFADGANLAETLEKAGVDFEVIPGLPVETAAPALSGIPLTVPGRAASVGLGSAEHADTVVLRVAPALWENGVSALIDAGHPPGRAAAFIVNPGTPEQRRVVAPLGQLLGIAHERGLEGDALLVSGPGVEMSKLLDTLARRPLRGKRVLVTRAPHQSEELRRQLHDLGAAVVEIPTIEIRPIKAGDEMARAIEHLPDTGLVIFTSANAVDIFFSILLELGHDVRELAASKVCAIGPETSRSLAARGLRADLVAGEYTAEGLLDALEGWDLNGMRVLVPRARMGRDALPTTLVEKGAEVTILPVYETVCPERSADELRRLFAGDGVDAITFTSSSTVVNFVSAFEGSLPDSVTRAAVACIGPVTGETARKLGLRADIIAREYTTRGLALAIAEALG